MAKQIGFTFVGSIEGFSFYHDRLHGYLVRRTGGATSHEFLTAPCYAAAREMSSDFSSVSSSGKLIRSALHEFIQPVKDASMVNRMNKELIALKQLDMQNPKGKRKAEAVLPNADLNCSFRAFQFNIRVNLLDLITFRFTTCYPNALANYGDHSNRMLTCHVKTLASLFPEEATHAGITLLKTVIDFHEKRFQTLSSRMGLTHRSNTNEVPLSIPDPANFAGIEIVCLQVLFFKEDDGDLIQLQGKVHGMGIIQIT